MAFSITDLEAMGLPVSRAPRIRAGQRVRIEAPGMAEQATGEILSGAMIPAIDGPCLGSVDVRLDGTGSVVRIPGDWLREEQARPER